MATPAPDLVVVASVAIHIELAWREACDMTGGEWPEGYCVETAQDLADALAGAGIEATATWGGFEFGQPESPEWDRILSHPIHAENALPRGQVGHAWVTLADGTIVDPTAGQYFPLARAALKIIPPDHDLHFRYHAVEPIGGRSD